MARRTVPLLDEPASSPTWKEFFCYTVNAAGQSALAANPNGANATPGQSQFSEFDVRIDSDADFEFLKTLYIATDPRVYAKYVDTTSGRQLHRGSLDLRLNAGSAVQTFGFATSAAPTAIAAPVESSEFVPFIWPQAHLIPAASVFAVQLADFSGAQNTTRLTFHGNKVRPGHAPYEVDENGRPRKYTRRLPYTYPCPPDASVAAAGANATVQAAVPIDMEADFLCTMITAQWQGAGTVLVEEANARRWMDTAVHVGLFGGNGLAPNRLPSPRFLPRGSTILVTFADLSGATNRWRLFFHGVKLYEG